MATSNKTDLQIVEAMIAETEAWYKRMRKLQDGIKGMGLSLDLDRTYDGYHTAIDNLHEAEERAAEEAKS